MNQILNGGMGPQNNGNVNLYGNYNEPKKGGTLSTETSVKIFAISLIVFGLIMVIIGIVNLVTADRAPKEEWPKFESQVNDNNELIVMISHDQIIEKVVYKWNSNGFETTIPGEQTKNMQVRLQIPVGDNVLNLTTIDVNGKESEYKKVFTGIIIEDNEKPDISLSLMGAKLYIVATSTTDTHISYLTYQWEDLDQQIIDEEVRVDATYDPTMIETQTPVKKGNSKIVITAVKENGVSDTITKTFNGVLKPSIEVKQENNKLKIIISHESGIESANILLNQKTISLSEDWFGADKKSIEFSVPLKSGENTIEIEAKSIAGSSDKYVGIATK